MSEELRKCPYCGEPFVITKTGVGEWLRYYVKHNPSCLMAYHFENVVGYTDIDLVTKELNTRPLEDALIAERDGLLAQVKDMDEVLQKYREYMITTTRKKDEIIDALLAKLAAAQPAIELAIKAINTLIDTQEYVSSNDNYLLNEMANGSNAIAILEGLKDEKGEKE